MSNGRVTLFLFQKILKRKFHGNCRSSSAAAHQIISGSNWKESIYMELETSTPKEINSACCIYRVPVNMLDVERKAYIPNIISIGPYHHGATEFQAMEEIKWNFFHRLFDPNRPNRVELDPVIGVLEKLEQEARSHYWDDFELSSEDFVKMMLMDGCFIVELLRELRRKHDMPDVPASPFIKRWMLPVLRRDLIMLENQLPLIVLQELFKLTSTASEESSSTSLQELAIHFFNPLLQRDVVSTPAQPKVNSGKNLFDHIDLCSFRANEYKGSDQQVAAVPVKEGLEGKHFLDIFRSRILPTTAILEEGVTQLGQNLETSMQIVTEEGMVGVETDMMRSATELKEAGAIIEKGKNCRPLDVRSEGRALIIPPLYLNDYRATLFRNLVAFEQCHRACKPQVTTYLFFFDGLINSAEDVDLLHHKGVLHHSLGSNKEVAKLVNNICREVARDSKESYLQKVVWDSNLYYSSTWATIRAKLVHHYFSSVAVTLSTFAAALALYLTLIQTGCGVADALEALKNNSFSTYLKHSFLLPFFDVPSSIDNPRDPAD